MKKLIATLTVSLALIFSAQAQTNTPPATNTSITVPQFFGTVWETVIGEGLTNLSVTTFGTYTPKNKQWGFGEMITRNIPIGGGFGTGIGVGVDYYGGDLYAVNANVGLNAEMRPLSTFGGFASNIVMVPFTFIGLGTPISGVGGGNGDVETIAAAGAMVRIAKILGAQFEIGGVYGTRSGIGDASGVFYGGLLDLTWRF